jgi:hypothetical protein
MIQMKKSHLTTINFSWVFKYQFLDKLIMKKIVFLFLFFSSIVLSQTRGISYQALIIDPVTQELPGVNNSSAPLADKNICLKFSIIDELEQLEYEEIFTTRTDDFGMVNLIIGTGTSTGGYASSFEGILWSALAKNLKVDLSLDEGCSNFTEISNAPFTAVPFALFALNTQDTPLGLDNAAELRLLEALLAATQIGAGLNTDGSYTPDAATNYIRNVTSLKEADTTLDSQIKNNEDNITANETTININTTAIGARVETTSIVDDLTTGGSTVPLSAEQGKVLKNLVDTSVNITVENNLTSTSTTNALSANQGRVLKGLVDANTTAITSNTNNINNINTLAAGKVYLGDVNGDAREAVLTGDVTLDNSGVTTITASAVTNAKLDKTNIPLSGFGGATDNVALGANKLTGVADPTVAQDAATKAYVDAANNINADLTGMVTSIGNVTTVVTNADLTGDITSVGNTTTIGADKVVSAMIVDETIVAADLANDAITKIKIADANVTNAKLDKTNIPLSGFGVAVADVDLGGKRLTEVGAPTVAQDAATKLYVDTTTDLNATDITTNATNITNNTDNINLKEDAANKSTDSTLADTTDDKFPTEKAVKTYVDTATDLNATDITTNATNITNNTDNINLKEDAANKSTDSTLADTTDDKFPTEKAVKTYVDTTTDLNATDITTNATNITNNTDNINLKEDAANKSTDITLADTTDDKFPTEKAVKTYVDAATSANANDISDKLPLAGGTMSGIINMDVNAIDNVSALTVDAINIDGKVITMTGAPAKTATITAGTGLTIATTDATGAVANIEISAAGIAELKGTEGVDIAELGVLTKVKGTLNVDDDVTLSAALDVAGAITAPIINGELNGTINTATTATTQLVGESSDKIATTAFVASGTANNVSGVVAVANGGTGATTATAGRKALGIYAFRFTLSGGSTTENINLTDLISEGHLPSGYIFIGTEIITATLNKGTSAVITSVFPASVTLNEDLDVLRINSTGANLPNDEVSIIIIPL